jgi:hypothetical protein
MSNNNLKNIAIIDRMRSVARVKTDVKLAEILGYSSTGTISQWKKNGVPNSAISKICEMFGGVFDQVKYGTGGRPLIESPQIREEPSPYIIKVAEMMSGMDEETQKDICLSVEKEKLLRDLLRQKEEEEKAG